MKKFLCLLFLSTIDAVSAYAAVIVLKDGSEVNGTVVSATAGEIQVYSGGGTQRIPTNQILRIDYTSSETPPAPAENPQRLPPSPYGYQRITITDLKQMFSFNIGLATPLSEVSFGGAGGGSQDNGDSGLLIGAEYLYLFTPRLGAGFDVEYMNRSDNASRGVLPAADTAVSGDTLLTLGVVRYTLTNRGSARPYLLAGLGANRTSTLIDAQPISGFAWSDTTTDETRRLVDDSQWGLASTLRFGIDFYFMEPALFSFEVGWTGVHNQRADATSAGKDLGIDSVTGALSTLVISGRWGWRF